MSEPFLVSIIINNYNYGRFLGDAIESALNQTYSRIEVVVVDDGSTDNSQDVMQQYSDRIVPVLKSNGGQASAFNAGFAASQGSILCFLDADDLFLPKKVEAIVDAFLKNPQSNWFFHPLQTVDETATFIEPARIQITTQEFDFRQTMQLGSLREVVSRLPFAIPATSGLCFARSLLDQILPMPEAENIALNDTYLQLTGFALSQGVAINQTLSLQRLHNSNAFTARKNQNSRIARIHVLTAYWLRANFPTSLGRISDQLFAKGLAFYWKSGGIEAQSKPMVQQYLTEAVLSEWLEIMARAVYRTIV